MPVDSIVITYRDYLLLGVIALSLIAAVVSLAVVTRQIFTDRGLARKEAVRVAAKL
jgi:TRAP-type C4-dicarboxylate transport system permease small subunit